MPVPKLRFPGFTGDWNQRKVREITSSFSGGTPKADTSEYYGGNIPFIRSGEIYSDKTELYITELGMENSSAKMIHEGDILYALYGATSGEVNRSKLNGAINQAILAIVPNKNINPNFLVEWFRKEKGTITDTYLQGGQGNLSAQIIKELDILIPSFEEQILIGDSLESMNNLITLYQRKYDELQELKKSMLQKLFPKEGETIPEIRFPGFTDDWEQRKLGDIMNVTSVKRIHQSDWTDSGIRFLRARDIVSASKNEEPDDYLYISKEKYNEYSLVSGKVAIGDLLVTGVGTIGVPYLIRNSEPLYFKDGNIIWFQNGTKIDGDFFLYSFFGKAIQDFINESAGIGTVGTYTIESGKKTPISLPEMKEQQQIGIYFRNLDNLIALHQRKCDELKELKKGLLQQMFC